LLQEFPASTLGHFSLAIELRENESLPVHASRDKERRDVRKRTRDTKITRRSYEQSYDSSSDKIGFHDFNSIILYRMFTLCDKYNHLCIIELIGKKNSS